MADQRPPSATGGSSRPWRSFRTGALALVLAVSFTCRFYRLDFDLPDVSYVDGFKFVGQAAHQAATGDLHPTDLGYPALYVDVLVAIYRALGVVSSYGQQLAANVVSALAGVALVGATAYVASPVCGTAGILLAAALVAVSPMAITLSRTPSPDTLCALLMTVAIGIVARRPGRLGSWALAGGAVGLATGAKWTGLFAAPVVGAALVATAWQRRDMRLFARGCIVTAAATGLAFLATTPLFLALRSEYAGGLAITMAVEHVGQIGRIQLGPLDYFWSQTPTWETPWLGTSLPADLGWPAILLAAGGLVLAAGGRLGFAGALYGATLAAFLFVVSGTGYLKAIRYLLPVVPLIAALAGSCVDCVLAAGRWRRAVAWVLCALVLVAPIRTSARYAMALTRPSTNALVREWMRSTIPPQTVVFLGPFFTDDLYPLPFRFRSLPNVGPRQCRLPPGVGLNPERDPIYTAAIADSLRAAGIEYVVLNSYFDDAFTPVAENLRFFPSSVANYRQFMTHLAAQAVLVHERIGWAEGRLGPDIRIWHIRPSG